MVRPEGCKGFVANKWLQTRCCKEVLAKNSLQRYLCIMGSKKKDEIVLEMAALKGLAHPLRVAIIDVLSAYGAATASTLAERLGESSGATSYHLRQLEKHGFVREDTTRGSGRERWWERVPRPISLNATEFGSAGADREASDLVMAEWQRNRQKRLGAFLSHGLDAVGKEWIEVSNVGTANVQLTREQMHDLTEELSAVVDGYLDKYRNQKTPGARPVQIHIDVFPIIDGVEQGSDVGGSVKDDK
jgi:DNA-binding transcriptional ArsR family regulator